MHERIPPAKNHVRKYNEMEMNMKNLLEPDKYLRKSNSYYRTKKKSSELVHDDKIPSTLASDIP